MNARKVKATPEPTLRRLPRYLYFLKNLREEGVKQVSSTFIASTLGLDPTQVRKDIEYTDVVGKPKKGFETGELIKAIESFLNWNNQTDAFLVGVGNLGTAMLGYGNFKKYGLNFVAAFDTDEEKLGKEVYGVEVFGLDKLVDLGIKKKINIGVLTTPATAAQEVADRFVEAGIKAIWNFAPIQLKVPENVIVENAQLTQSLALLSRKLKESV